MLTFRASSLVLAAIINATLGYYALAKGSKSNVNRSLAAYTFLLSFWGTSAFLFEILSSRESLLLAGRMSFFWGGLSAAGSLAFIVVYCEKDKCGSFFNKIALIFLIGFIFSTLGLTPFVMKDIIRRPWGNDTVLAPGYKIFVFYVTVFLSFGMFKLVQKHKKAKRGLDRLQLKYLIFAFGFTLPIGAHFAVYLPLITNSGRYFYVTGLSSIFTASIICYAIVRHRLLEIRMVASKTMSLTAAVIGIFALLFILDFLLHTMLHLPHNLSLLLSALIFTVLIRTFRPNLETQFKRIFLKDVFTYQIALRDFSRQLTTILDLPRLQNFIVEKIGQIMMIDTVTLFLLDEYGKKCRAEATYHHDKNLSQIDNIHINSPVFMRLKEVQQVLILDEIAKFVPEEKLKGLIKEFRRLSSKLLIPLIVRGRLMGILSLGSKRKGSIYSDEDVNLLRSIADEAALAIENAKLYNEVLLIRDNYEMILQQMDNGVISADIQGIVVTFNMRAGEILGTEPQEIVGKHIDRLDDKITSVFQKTLQGEKYFNHLMSIFQPHMKEKIILNLSSSLIRNREGEMLGGLLVFSDVTELQRLEEEVRRGEKLATLGAMAARVAHEIRNPLVSVKTFCQILPDKYQEQGFRDKFLPLVSNEVDRISHITEDLLNLSRVSPKMLKWVNIQDVLEESLVLVDEGLKEKEIRVSKNYTRECIALWTDPDKLKQVFLNLFTNSVQAMDQGGMLTVATTIEGDGQIQQSYLPVHVSEQSPSHGTNNQIGCIRISDTGKGIPEEDLCEIFEPFFTTKERGSGLGLVISKEIVKELKGSIEVESKPGAGSTFIIRLPLSNENMEKDNG